jgi:phosphoribosylanthranilate isomerase
MKVKVCGMTRYEDARLALDLGAWAIGLVFHPPSPRAIAPEKAAELIARLPADTISVGVFVDAPLEDVNRAVERIGLKAVQLHGAETPEYAAGVKAGRVIKAFRVRAGFDDARIDDYPECLILLDAHVEGLPGGTGRAFEWDIARKAWERAPIILAGGLNPENVEEAIRTVRPMAVDVSSGVEARPGEKDPKKLRLLFDAVHRAAV